MPYKIVRYQNNNQKVPYTDWINKSRKRNPQAASSKQQASKVAVQISRACVGNFAAHKFERKGVWALQSNYDQGYRCREWAYNSLISWR